MVKSRAERGLRPTFVLRHRDFTLHPSANSRGIQMIWHLSNMVEYLRMNVAGFIAEQEDVSFCKFD